MALDVTEPRTRRAVLAATLGGLAATLASALGRPAIVRAGQDGDVVLEANNLAAYETRISNNNTNSEDVFVAVTTGNGIGVIGESNSGYGVAGNSGSWVGVAGTTSATDQPGVRGQSRGNSTGVFGFSGAVNATLPAAPPNTGLYGEANQDSTARGVFGKTTVGQAVRGQATTGIAGYFTATGTALQTTGKVKLNRSGNASIPANASYVDVTVPGGLTGTPLPFANLQAHRTGVHIEAIRPNYPSSGVMRIYLNKVASTTLSTPVSWLVLG